MVPDSSVHDPIREESSCYTAELADMTVWDFAQLAREQDVTWIGREGLEDDLNTF